MLSAMQRRLPIIVLICGFVLTAPFVAALIWLQSQHMVGVSIDLESWRVWAILLSPVVGLCAIVWSITQLLRKPHA
jgi:hypothetical protein